MLDPVIVDAVYDLVTCEEAFEPLLVALAAYFHCPSAALIYVDPLRPSVAVQRSFGRLSGDALVRYQTEFAAIDPAPSAIVALPLGKAAATDRLFSEEERNASPFLREFYWPIGLREALGAPIARDGRQFGLVAVHRGPERPPFTDREIEDFAEIATHIARAVDLRNRFFALNDASDIKSDALNASAAGVIVIDNNGIMKYANAAARRTLSRNDGLTLSRSGNLRARDAAANERLQAALTMETAPRSAILSIPRGSLEPPYIVRVRKRRRGLLLQIAAGPAPFEEIEPVLLDAFGLTAQAARLVACLIGGDDLATCAAKLGVSRNTAKFHLRTAFDATQTTRQADLIQRATTVLRDLGFQGGGRTTLEAAGKKSLMRSRCAIRTDIGRHPFDRMLSRFSARNHRRLSIWTISRRGLFGIHPSSRQSGFLLRGRGDGERSGSEEKEVSPRRP